MKRHLIKVQTILFLHNNNDLYGAEVILLELLKGLDCSRFSPVVVLPADTKHINRLSARLDQEGIEYHFIRMAVLRRKYFHLLGVAQYAIDLLSGILSLIALIRRRRVALVHSNTLAVVCGAIAAWITRTPHVWHIHEIIVDPVPARKVMHFLACHLSDSVVAVSGSVRDHLLADCPGATEKIKVIHNGIDCAPFLLEPDGLKIREEFGVPPNTLLVGMVGKVCRWKGQLVFAEAARLVLEQRPDVRFIAVGGVFDDELHYMQQFRQRVKALELEDRFSVGDFRTDIRDVLASLDIFVLPSTQPDPFPTVVLEAMAAGKAVIATRHGGSAEMVVDGETGFLIEPRSPSALANAILRLAEDPSLIRSMGKAGRQRVRELFDARSFVNEIQHLYALLANGRVQNRLPRPTNIPVGE